MPDYFDNKVNYLRVLAPLLSSFIFMYPCDEPAYQQKVLSRDAMKVIWITVLIALGFLWIRGHVLAENPMKHWIDGWNIVFIIAMCAWAILYRCQHDKANAFIVTLLSWTITCALLVTYLQVDYMTSLIMSFIVAWMALVLIAAYSEANDPEPFQTL